MVCLDSLNSTIYALRRVYNHLSISLMHVAFHFMYSTHSYYCNFRELPEGATITNVQDIYSNALEID